MIRRTARRYILWVLALVVVGALAPLPYVLVEPGIPNDTFATVKSKPLLEIIGKQTYPTTGKLNLTSIWVTNPDSHLHSVELLRAWIDGERSVQPREVFYPAGTDIKKVNAQNVAEMKNSQINAKLAALNHLEIGYSTKFLIKGFTADSQNKGKLAIDDQVISFDGQKISSLLQLKKLITNSNKSEVALAVIRNGKNLSIPIRIRSEAALPDSPANNSADRSAVSSAKKNSIGIFLVEDYTLPFDVKIHLKNIGGPSAGLIFTLAIVDKLTSEDLVKKRNVAGTGTITPAGKVGPIGGIEEKLIGAAREGATLFLAPALNCPDIKHIPKGLTVVPVDTLDEAIAALRESDPERLPICG